ncbi:hypothetical protein Dimus_010662 [Dionaea muscipula]
MKSRRNQTIGKEKLTGESKNDRGDGAIEAAGRKSERMNETGGQPEQRKTLGQRTKRNKEAEIGFPDSLFLFLFYLGFLCPKRLVARLSCLTSFSGGGLAPPAWHRRRPTLEGDVLTQPRRHRTLVDECRRHLQVAHPRMMWSYDSAKNRELRVRSVVERMFGEGMGSEEEDSRPILPDFAVSVDPMVDLAPTGVLEPDLKASSDGLSLTMAENLHDQSFALLDARGCEVVQGSMVQGPSMGSVVLSDGGGSEKKEAELPDDQLVASVIISAPAMRFVDGEEVQEIEAGPGAALSPPCPIVSYPSSPRCDGLLVVAAEDRGSTAVKGPSPAVSGLSDAGGGQALGDSLAALKTRGLGNHLAADTVVNSVIPVTSLSYICPSLRADSVDFAASMLSNNDGTLIEGGMVSEEGLVSLAAREALRLSPTDGRRQPPLSPVEPAMVTMRGGLLHGGGQASRSYAHVVHADR